MFVIGCLLNTTERLGADFFSKGKGIEAGLQESILRMFEENNENEIDSEEFNGAVGLIIAAEIVRKMKGAVKVGSKLGEGTEFNVSWRLCVLTLRNSHSVGGGGDVEVVAVVPSSKQTNKLLARAVAISIRNMVVYISTLKL